MVIGKINYFNKKFPVFTTLKINSRWTKHPNVRKNSLKFLEGNIEYVILNRP